MEQNNSITKVREFMTTFKQPVFDTPIVPNEARVKLRLSLILEEFVEIARDCGATEILSSLMNKKLTEIGEYLGKLDAEGKDEMPNLKGILDNLVDLRYVADGMTHEFGLGNVFDAAFEDVHKANMAKTCSTEEEAIETVSKYKSEGIETYYEFYNNKYLIYRTADKKALKSVNWKEADLSKYVQE